MLAQQFVAAVAELFFCLDVQQDDLAGLVDHDHGIGRRLEQAAILLFHLQKVLFGGLANADVADRGRHQDARRAVARAEHDLDGEFAAVLAAARQFDAGADLLGQRIGLAARGVGDQPLGEARRDDVRDLLAQQLVAAIAELLLGLDVQKNNLACLVDDNHGIGRRFEQLAVLVFHWKHSPAAFGSASQTLPPMVAIETDYSPQIRS